MSFFVADPHWGIWILLYFFLGGIAAGAYFTATLIEMVGSQDDRALAQGGYWIAFPLVTFCGIFLIVDLDHPERFWHMLFKSQVVHEALRTNWPWSAQGWRVMSTAPLFKHWSPMSVGSWALLGFGTCSFLSFLGSLRPDGFPGRWLHRGVVGRLLQVVGCGLGFFVAAYTGSLLTATNQPIWSDSVWIAALFLTSAASTGIAALIVLARWSGRSEHDSIERLERADLWAIVLELIVFAVFLATLGEDLPLVLSTRSGKLLIGGTLLLAIIAPLAIHLRLGLASRGWATTAAGLALLGGLCLRQGMLATPAELLNRGHQTVCFSPEDGRVAGGGRGADVGNRPVQLRRGGRESSGQVVP